MILTEKVKVRITYQTNKHYNDIGYIVNNGDVLEIHINHLPDGSRLIVDVACDICGEKKSKPYREYLQSKNNNDLYTCTKCSSFKNKITKKEKYDDENFNNRNKCKETNIEKYGVENVFQSEEIKEKSKETCLDKYGKEYYQQTDDMKNKSKETCLKKYDTEYYLQSIDKKEKSEETCLEKYGFMIPSKNEDVKIKISKSIKNTLYKKSFEIYDNLINVIGDDLIIYCDVCNNNFTISKSMYQNRKHDKINICTCCNPINKQYSSFEKEISDFIISVDIKTQLKNKTIIKPYELDIYLPEFNLAFEFNGLYWHSEMYKDKNYHKMKSDLCEEKGTQLIHIWEDDWKYKQEIVKSMILNKLNQTKNKIYARKCEIKLVEDNKLIKEFLDNNHMQGSIGSSIKIGLYYNDELVSLMTFGKKRISQKSSSKDGEYELLRFCNKLNTNVVGGASKLFKYFTNNFDYKEIITYADRSHSNGNLYKELGFNFVHKTQPNYHYIIDKIRKHRFGFRKDVLVSKGYDKNKSEHEIMLERKIYRIYNAGNYKFIYS